MQGVCAESDFRIPDAAKEFASRGKKVLTIVALSGIICKSS